MQKYIINNKYMFNCVVIVIKKKKQQKHTLEKLFIAFSKLKIIRANIGEDI